MSTSPIGLLKSAGKIASCGFLSPVLVKKGRVTTFIRFVFFSFFPEVSFYIPWLSPLDFIGCSSSKNFLPGFETLCKILNIK